MSATYCAGSLEPPPGVDDRPEPPPVTNMSATRKAAARIDWQQVSLTNLLSYTSPDGRRASGVSLYVSAAVADDPVFPRMSNASATGG